MSGGLLAGWLAFCVSIGALALIVTLVERRTFRVRDQYLSFLPGDLLLTALVAVGWWGNTAGQLPLAWYATWLAVGALVGVVQMWSELERGAYTRGQAFSPSHLWHQFVTYPVMGCLAASAFVFAWSEWELLAVMGPLLAAWALCVIWDQSHIKPAHVDFDWPCN